MANNIVKSLVKTKIPSVFQRVLGSLPGKDSSLQMAFAYGSGVFQQEGQDMSKNMLDFMVVVDDPLKWHQENLKLNRKHYSFLSYLGPKYITKIQDRLGAGIYFNTEVPFEDRLIKYGVISTDRLVTDLLDWDTLYVSGRLHKPVRLIAIPESGDLRQAMHINLQSAVHAALLLLPESFTEEEFFLKISSLSYAGDFRMTFGEDKNKVSNIVRPNIAHFRQLYEHFLDREEHIHWHKNQGKIEQYPNHITQFHHLNLLPKMVQLNLLSLRSSLENSLDLEEVIRTLAHDSHCDEYVEKSIANIVKRSSKTQSFKTIFSAGVLKSITYSWKKVKKMWKGGNKHVKKNVM